MTNCIEILRKSATTFGKFLEISGICEKFHFSFHFFIRLASRLCRKGLVYPFQKVHSSPSPNTGSYLFSFVPSRSRSFETSFEISRRRTFEITCAARIRERFELLPREGQGL